MSDKKRGLDAFYDKYKEQSTSRQKYWLALCVAAVVGVIAFTLGYLGGLF